MHEPSTRISLQGCTGVHPGPWAPLTRRPPGLRRGPPTPEGEPSASHVWSRHSTSADGTRSLCLRTQWAFRMPCGGGGAGGGNMRCPAPGPGSRDPREGDPWGRARNSSGAPPPPAGWRARWPGGSVPTAGVVPRSGRDSVTRGGDCCRRKAESSGVDAGDAHQRHQGHGGVSSSSGKVSMLSRVPASQHTPQPLPGPYLDGSILGSGAAQLSPKQPPSSLLRPPPALPSGATQLVIGEWRCPRLQEGTADLHLPTAEFGLREERVLRLLGFLGHGRSPDGAAGGASHPYDPAVLPWAERPLHKMRAVTRVHSGSLRCGLGRGRLRERLPKLERRLRTLALADGQSFADPGRQQVVLDGRNNLAISSFTMLKTVGNVKSYGCWFRV